MAASAYDPESYWNARGRQYSSDPLRAACLDDADENRCIDRIQRRVVRLAFRQLQRHTTLAGKAVLDFGCGSGRWVSFLRSYGLVYSGADIAMEMLAIARRQHPDADVRRISDAPLPYPTRSVDVVLAVAVLHHNGYDAQERIVAELARVLRSDGALILFEGVGPQGASDFNYHPRPLAEWQELLARHGLSCTWQRGATYFLLRPLATRTARWMRPALLQPWRALLTRIDAVADPYLLSLLPQRYHTRVVMLCERTVPTSR
jgi:SAM-dependent methyltransferase